MKNKKICFAASDGGHIEQIKQLFELKEIYDNFLVTERTLTTGDIGRKMKVYYLKHINRAENLFVLKFLLNILLSFRIILLEQPTHIISTGALAAFPICLIGKLFRKKIIFIESYSKTNSGTITGKLVYKFADMFIIQRESLRKIYPKAIYGGSIY